MESIGLSHRLLAACVALLFLFGVGAAACASAHPKRLPAPKPVVRLPSAPAERLLEAIRLHPDPAISRDFRKRIVDGHIKVMVESPENRAQATFGPGPTKGFELKMRPDFVVVNPTLHQMQDIFVLLSHEHAHYQQYKEGLLAKYLLKGRRQSETQCAHAITVEIGAFAKACRDSKKYGWTSGAAKRACRENPSSIATAFMHDRALEYPDCVPVWRFFIEQESEPKPPPVPQTSVRLPNRGAPSYLAGEPIYLPPP